MSEAITVFCPSCKASLKLKSRSAVGKRVPCPKCKKPFVVTEPAPESHDELAFLSASESSGAMPVSEDDEEAEAAAAQAPESTGRGSGSRRKKGKGKTAAPVNWLKPLLIGVAALAFVGLLVGGGMFAVSFIGGMSKNKIDLTYLPPEADLVVYARVDDLLASPFLQSVVAKPALKQSLDKLTEKFHVSLGDIKSITVGVAGAGKLNMTNVGGLANLGMGAGGPPPARATATPYLATVTVIRMSKDLPADFMAKVSGYESYSHQGKATYFRQPGPMRLENKPSVYVAAPQVLVVAGEMEIQRIIDKGFQQVRRGEFDFVETTSQIVVAMLNNSSAEPATPAAGGTPGGGMPGGMAGGGMGPGAGGAPGLGGLANSPSLANGKLKGSYLGISFTQDIEIRSGLYCPDSAKDAQADIEREIAKQKSEFAANKPQLGMMLGLFGFGDIVPYIETTVNSLNVTGTGSVVQISAQVPGAIATSVEKSLIGMAGGNPFGGPQSADGPPDDSSGSPTDPAANTPSSQNPPVSP